jgi:Flp pilus assembly protein TadG
MPRRSPGREREAGQVLALFAFGFLAFVAGTAFVVDGGNIYSNHRISQNATDAAAQAGAVVLAERLGGATRNDNAVRSAVDGVLSAMEMDVVNSVAEYTDIDGNSLTPPVVVGSLGTAQPPNSAWGVAVNGDRDFGTFFARALGINEFTATTHATAITGYGQALGSNLLPVTPPINIVTCDGQNNPVFDLPPVHWSGYELYKIPLCKNGPGNVGWIDWTPPAGGTSELVAEILSSTGSIDIPSWNYVTQTGNVNSKNVEDALRTYNGRVVYIPIFDSTCNSEPTPGDTSVDACAPANVGGNGQNQWYHFPEVAAFQFCPGDPSSTDPVDQAFASACSNAGSAHGAYVNGNNKNQCDTGNGATSCLVGRFVNFITEGTVSGPLSGLPGPSTAVVVQLIK